MHKFSDHYYFTKKLNKCKLRKINLHLFKSKETYMGCQLHLPVTDCLLMSANCPLVHLHAGLGDQFCFFSLFLLQFLLIIKLLNLFYTLAKRLQGTSSTYVICWAKTHKKTIFNKNALKFNDTHASKKITHALITLRHFSNQQNLKFTGLATYKEYKNLSLVSIE